MDKKTLKKFACFLLDYQQESGETLASDEIEFLADKFIKENKTN